MSRKKGIPKSKLIWGWVEALNTFDSVPESIYGNSLSSSYNLRIPVELYSIIQHLSQTSNRSVSTWIRDLITTKLERYEMTLKSLWRRGEIKQVSELFVDPNFHKYTVDELFILGRTAVQRGDFPKALGIASFLENLVEDVGLKPLIIRGEVAYYEYDRQVAERVSKAIRGVDIWQLSQDDLLIYYIGGILNFIDDDIPKSKQLLHDSLGLINAKHNPLDVIRIFGRLGSIATYEGQNLDAIANFKRGETIAKKSGNRYGLAWAYHTWGTNLYRHGKFTEASEKTGFAVGVNKDLGAKPQLAYGLDNLARLKYMQGDVDQAYIGLNQVYQFEKKHGLKKIFAPSLAFMQFIEGKASMRGDSKYIVPGFCKYLDATNQFLKGTTSKVNEDGKRILIEMSKDGRYDLIQRSAKETLREKKLQPMR